MRTHCVYKKCRFNCQSKSDHKIAYAKMKTYYSKKDIAPFKIDKKLPSSKVNWSKYNELFSNK